MFDTTIAGIPPMKAKVRVCEPIQSHRPRVQVNLRIGVNSTHPARRPPSRSVDHRERHAGVVDEQTLGGDVALPRGRQRRE